MKPVALITGASKGIGLAIAQKFLANQFTVISVSRSGSGVGILYSVDVRHELSVSEFASALTEKNFTVDLLVNSAGLGYFESIENTTLKNWQETLDVNLTGTFLMTKAMLPLLKKSEKAHIFNLCSMASRKGYSGCGAYSASKFGLLGFTEVLREELRSFAIKVTAVLPGAVATPFWEKAGGGSFDKSKMLSPHDIAESIFFTYQQNKNSVIEELLIRPSCGDL